MKTKFENNKRFDIQSSLFTEFENEINLRDVRANINSICIRKAQEKEIQLLKLKAEQEKLRLEEINRENMKRENERVEKLRLEMNAKLEQERFKSEQERLRFQNIEAQNRNNEYNRVNHLQQQWRSNFDAPSASPAQSSNSSSSRSYYESNGSANGREVFTGPRGGTYYVNSSGNKQYVSKNRVKDYDD